MTFHVGRLIDVLGLPPTKYGAFVLDPDGNNKADLHGPAIRSAPSVTIEPAP